MSRQGNPIRLWGEILAIVAVAETAVMLALPYLAPGLHGLEQGLLDVALLLLLSSPTVYWRCMTTTRPRANHATRLYDTAAARGSIKLAVFMTGAAQMLGVALTVGAVLWLQRTIDASNQTRFDRGVERVETEIKRRLDLPLMGLKGARGVYAASEKVTRTEFRAYVESRNLAQEFPGIRGMGFIQHVMRRDLPHFLAGARADGAPDFAISSQGDAPDLYVVKYIEPLASNQAALGFDVGQEAVRREAIERAVNSGEPAMTGRVLLVQAVARGDAFLYLLPVFRQGAVLTTPKQRQEALLGLLHAPIVVADVMEGAAGAAGEPLQLQMFDGDGTQPDQLLFTANDQQSGGESSPPLADPADSQIARVQRLQVGGHTLTLRVSTTAAFNAAVDRSSVLALGVGGVFASFLLSLATWLLMVGRVRAENRAQRMTAELATMARVAQTTSNAVIVTDPELRIVWVNAGFTRVSGYTLEEARGKTPRALLGTSKTLPATLANLSRAAELGDHCRAEVVNRAKDGHEYWMDIDVQPTRDAQGMLVGFMELGSDITEQKRSQLALEAAVLKADALLYTLNRHAIVSVTDRAGTIIEANDAFCRISGYSREELLGQNHRIVNSGLHPPQFWVDMWRTIAACEPWRGEVCNRAKDGSLYWVDSMLASFVSHDGQIEKYISIRTDITARVRAQEALQTSRDLLEYSQSIAKLGGWELDLVTQQLYWTAETYRIHETRPAVFHPTVAACLGYFLSESRIKITAALGAAMAQGIGYDLELEILTTQGRRIDVRTTCTVSLKDGKPAKLTGIFQDITERRDNERRVHDAFEVAERARDEVRHSQEVLRSSIEALDDGFVIYDKDDRILLCNQRYKDFYPESAEVMVAGTPFEAIVRFGAERGQYRDATGRVDEWVAERMVLHRQDISRGQQYLNDGRVLRVVERRTPAGHTVGFRVDITDLVNATEAAEDASRATSQFLANMSHEIRTPMNAILGLLALLKYTELSTVQRDYADKTEGAARSLLGLINDILDFSKVEAGKMQFDPRPFRSAQLQRDVSVILSSYLGSKNVALRFETDPDVPPLLRGDDMRLRQVLINLGSNAIKFTPAGEVVLSQRVIARSQEDVVLEFAVRDTGIGIALENQAHIFSGFSQAESSTTRRFGGTGLGLAISQRLVSLMGGELLLESNLGAGSTFSFRVRLGFADAQDVAELPEGGLSDGQSRRLQGLHVLVVEDNKLNQMVAQGLLEQEGARVTLADNGRLGVEAVAHATALFDAVLMDLQMPEMDGFEATRTIRQAWGAELLPIIAMTANAMTADSEACLTVGMNDYVGKPFELDHLVAVLLHHTRRSGTAEAGFVPVIAAAHSVVAGVSAAADIELQPGDLDVPGALHRFGGDQRLFANALQTFSKEIGGLSEPLQDYAAAGDPALAQRVLHTLKGLAGTLGARHLAQVAAQQERRVKEGVPLHERPLLVHTMLDALHATEQAIAPVRAHYLALLSSAPSREVPEGERTSLLTDLQALMALLQTDDMAAMEAHAHLREVHAPVLKAALDPLDEAMASLDFSQAHTHCQTLMELSE